MRKKLASVSASCRGSGRDKSVADSARENATVYSDYATSETIPAASASSFRRGVVLSVPADKLGGWSVAR